MSRFAPIRVASVNAAAPLIRAVTTSSNGNAPDCIFDAAGPIETRLRSSEDADVAILPIARIRSLERDGFLIPGSSRDIGRTETAAAVRSCEAAATPLTGDGLRIVLLEAPAIFIPNPASSTAGHHMAATFADMNVLQFIERSLVVCANGADAMRLLALSPFAGAIGFTQSTEIMGAAGVRLLGPLPDAFGLTTIYSAGVIATSVEKASASRYVDVLCGPRSAHSRLNAGFF